MKVEYLVEKHQNAVYRHMLRVCHGHREDAEDALAEAILAALKASESLRFENAFRSWLVTVATRICQRMRHRESLVKTISLSLTELAETLAAPDPSPDEEAALEHFMAEVRELPSRLPPLYRQVYERIDLHGQPIHEVANEAGISLAAAKTRLRRARQMVRGRLGDALTTSRP